MLERRDLKYMSMKSGKYVALFTAVVLMLVLVIGGSVAYLMTETDPVQNFFHPTSNVPVIEETFVDGIKSDVKVRIDGDTEVSSYVRAKIVFSWENEAGQVAATTVNTSDYELIIGTDWVQGDDGYYYYKGTVNGGSATTDLIEQCTAKRNIDDEYYLCVEILAQTIQSSPDTAVQNAWKMSYSNSTWTPYTAGTN